MHVSNMALFDDKRFLLSHIRHSFITGDDTGVCEMVMLHEIMPHYTPEEDEQLKGKCLMALFSLSIF